MSTKVPEVDLYELLDISPTSTTKEIKKAYRRKALTCHPDKQQDNPKAAELFHELSKALEILIDDAARAAYDALRKAKAAAKQRRQNLDSRYKKLREDLEEREKKAQEEDARLGSMNFDYRSSEDKLEAEVERLRKEGSRQVKEEQEAVRQQLLREARVKDIVHKQQAAGSRLRVQWKADKNDPTNGGYDYPTLHTILSKHGNVTALIMSAKKKGSALVEYSTPEAAVLAKEVEQGMSCNPLSLWWLGEAHENHSTLPSASPSPRIIPITTARVAQTTGGLDFEDLVLGRLRQAAKKQGQEQSAQQDLS